MTGTGIDEGTGDDIQVQSCLVSALTSLALLRGLVMLVGVCEITVGIALLSP